jgi:ABC-2 type transport system ATP-binding protein
VIEVTNLVKQYGDLTAVAEVSFTAQPGKIFGLLGPNGAGKTTTIGCISGLLKPSSGSITILGHDVATAGRESRRQLGIVPQELALYEDLTAQENLSYWGAAYGLRGKKLKSRISEVLDITGLSDRARQQVKKLSGGLKRRLNFACGIVHQPKVLLLDEPTVGVDPQSRVRLLELVRSQTQAGICVLYTTHYMEEAESLCDHLAIIDHGRIIAAGTLAELRAELGENDIVRLAGRFDPKATQKALADLDNVEIVSVDEQGLRLAVFQATMNFSAIFEALSRTGAEIRETTLTQPSLESLFIKLTGKDLRD